MKKAFKAQIRQPEAAKKQNIAAGTCKNAAPKIF
jgi:hypothetical protein